MQSADCRMHNAVRDIAIRSALCTLHSALKGWLRSVSLALAVCLACRGGDVAEEGPLVVFTAGSLARPMRAALDSFAATTGVRYEMESAGSLETARKLTELGK